MNREQSNVLGVHQWKKTFPCSLYLVWRKGSSPFVFYSRGAPVALISISQRCRCSVGLQIRPARTGESPNLPHSWETVRFPSSVVTCSQFSCLVLAEQMQAVHGVCSDYASRDDEGPARAHAARNCWCPVDFFLLIFSPSGSADWSIVPRCLFLRKAGSEQWKNWERGVIKDLLMHWETSQWIGGRTASFLLVSCHGTAGMT